MYSLAKRLITEKNLVRKILILENLVNHPKATAKELAAAIGVSERTVFHDLQLLRMELPSDWQLISDGNNGLLLLSTTQAVPKDIWEYFLKESLSIQLIKALLHSKQLSTQSFLHNQGTSVETLRRHVGKLNKELAAFQLTIKVSVSTVELLGEESSIRVFYHRLLGPFTHNNFFFEDFPIHQANYTDFLRKINQFNLQVSTEQSFGTCWFFINSIRIKAGCLIEPFSFHYDDKLFVHYQTAIQQLYLSEGIRLQKDELFFAFFCFIESWNYSIFTDEMKRFLQESYTSLFQSCHQFVEKISEHMNLNSLIHSELQNNLVLFLLKYYESKQLSDKFLLEYPEVLSLSQDRFPVLHQTVYAAMAQYGLLEQLPNSDYVVNTVVLLIQEAIYTVQPQQITAYFIFQGEPSWKNFLFRELQDMLGNRVFVKSLDADELERQSMASEDIIISNYPISQQYSQSVIYISSVPTSNELADLRTVVAPLYIDGQSYRG